MSKDNVVQRIGMNFSFGLIGQFITMLLGIFVPRLFVVNFGSEYNGYISSINQVFVYIALLEAGVGAASLQALYHPCGTDDKDKINGILSATNKYYKKTGWLYVAIVLAGACIYPLAIYSELDYFNMAVLFAIMGVSGAIPYFTYAKYKILFKAEGKNYFITNASTIINVFISLSKILFLLWGCSVFVIQSVYLIFNLIHAEIYEIYIRKKYKWLDLKVAPEKGAISQKNSVLIHEISRLVFNNTDILFLAFFFDLYQVSIYTMYKTLINIVAAVISNIADSVSFRLGQVYKNRELFIKYHDIYETIHLAITFALFSVTLVFFIPFLELYADGMDINYVVRYLPLLFVMMEILNYGRVPSGNVITYAGKFKETRFRSAMESILNIVFTALFSIWFGIYGVLMGTIAALLYRTNDIIIYCNKKILNRECWRVYSQWILNITLSTIFVFLMTRVIHLDFSSYVSLILSAVVTCVVIVPIQILVCLLANKAARENLWVMLRKTK